MIAVPPAHAGHLLIDLPIFLGPVVLIGVALAWMNRHGGGEDEDD